MALAVTLQFDFKDAKNKTSFTRVRVPTGFSIAQYVEFAQDAAQLFANVSTCRLVGASVNFAIDIAASLTNVAGNLADIAEKAFFQFKSSVSGLFTRFKLPTFDADNLTTPGSDGTDLVDTADLDVAALITYIEGGATVTGGTIEFTDKYNNPVSELSFAVENFMEHA